MTKLASYEERLLARRGGEEQGGDGEAREQIGGAREAAYRRRRARSGEQLGFRPGRDRERDAAAREGASGRKRRRSPAIQGSSSAQGRPGRGAALGEVGTQLLGSSVPRLKKTEKKNNFQ